MHTHMQVYRTLLAVEGGDQRVAAELLLNASQCDFSNRQLWNQTEITRWLTKVHSHMCVCVCVRARARVHACVCVDKHT